MASSNFDVLKSAMSKPLDYPNNLKYLNGQKHRVSLGQQLERRAPGLFCENLTTGASRSKAAVELLELEVVSDEQDCIAFSDEACVEPLRTGDRLTWVSHSLLDAGEMKHQLCLSSSSGRREPLQRLIFVYAPTSRRPLEITKQMFLQVLTWHHVMPSFVEFVFPFGKQPRARDSLLMGFRSESRLRQPNVRFPVPELNRFGRQLEFCYSLKSVERTGEDSDDLVENWSVRQCSVYHSFDLKSEQSTWMVIKGNKVISDRFDTQVREDFDGECGSTDTLPSPFASSLALHSIVATWASEDWHWYISDLETHLRNLTEDALAASFEVELFPTLSNLAKCQEPMPLTRRQQTMKSIKRAATWSTWRDGFRWHNIKRVAKLLTGPSNDSDTPTRTGTADTEKSPNLAEANGFDEFSFHDLQDIHFIEEKANEMATILEANSRIINNLRKEYDDLAACISDSEFTERQRLNWPAAISSFGKDIASVDEDLRMQQARVGSLLRLVADRKGLLNGILQYRSMEANRLYAQKSQQSALEMQRITEEMHEIAEKTKRDTVSMKIITWVTLFFLPGTFISTLMSTPIVHFGNHKEDFSFMKNVGWGALKLYLAMSLPLVALTLIGWYGIRLREKYKDKKEREKKRNERAFGNEKGNDR